MLAERLETRTIRTHDKRTLFRPGAGLMDAERAAIAARIGELDRDLAYRAGPDEPVIEWVARQLMASMKSRRDGDDAALVADGFMIALEGQPVAAIREAVRGVLRRQWPEVSRVFVPTAPELADLAMTVARGWEAARARLQRLLEMEEERQEPEVPPLGPEEQARLQARIAALTRKGEAFGFAVAGSDGARLEEGAGVPASGLPLKGGVENPVPASAERSEKLTGGAEKRSPAARVAAEIAARKAAVAGRRGIGHNS